MRLQILQVPDCPNAVLLRQRLAQVVGESDGEVAVEVIADIDEAVTAGMAGSPTLLVDGVDPFAEPGSAPSVSCRLYRDADGQVSGAPSVSALRKILRG